MTYADLYQILVEAEARVARFSNSQFAGDDKVARNSQETVDLCLERMRREGLDRKQLKALARRTRWTTNA